MPLVRRCSAGAAWTVRFSARRDLLVASRALGGCETGDAKMTSGFRLKARYIIHAVGPVWRGGTNGEPDLLTSCYRRALALASGEGLRSIAFPSISTGVYGYPVKPAARIAIETARTFTGSATKVREVVFCCFSAADLAVYEELLQT